MTINLTNKKLTDEECYENIKRLHKKYPNNFMNPEEWKNLRLINIRKEGGLWTK